MPRGTKKVRGLAVSENGSVGEPKPRKPSSTGRTFSSTKPLPEWLPLELPVEHSQIWPIIVQIQEATELPKGAIQFSRAYKSMREHEELAKQARTAMLAGWDYIHGSHGSKQKAVSSPAKRARDFFGDMATAMLLRFCVAHSIDANGLDREQIISALVSATVVSDEQVSEPELA